jgi:hypothetical protein
LPSTKLAARAGRRRPPEGDFGLEDFAVSELDDPVGDVEQERVVCRDDGRHTFAPDKLQDDLNDRPGVRRIELARGLVGDASSSLSVSSRA